MTSQPVQAKLSKLRTAEAQLDQVASALDVQTDIGFRETLQILLRVGMYYRHFKARISAKIGFITVESMFRLLIVPWPGKIVVDHVVLGQPIPEDAAGYPAFLAPFVLFLAGKSPIEMMLWVVLVGVLMVIVFGVTPNRGAGRSPSGMPTGAAAGASGAAGAWLAQGHDTATQTENEANRAGSLMGGLLGILDFKVNLRLSQVLNHLMRSQLSARIKSLPMTTLDDQRIGDTVYRVLYDTTSATLLLEGLTVGMYSGVLGIVVSLVMMHVYYGSAPEIIVLAILTFPLMLVAVVPFARMARRRSQASRASGANTTSNIEEGMSNVLAVQSLGGNKRESERFKRASSESFKRFRLEAIVKLSFQQVGSLAFMLGQVIFFIVMAKQVIDGAFTAGDYFVVVYYFFVLSATFSAWGYMYTEWQVYIAGLRRVFFLMDLPTENETSGQTLPPIEKGVFMHDVGLVYPDGRRALRGVNFEARIGEIVALAGPTGAGKTSLAYLVPGFLQPTEGKVTIDGIDIERVAVNSIRAQVSYVFQETQLFSDSIFDNIRYGNVDATRGDVERAARTAGAHAFIEQLPNGYDTNLGTVTSKLSVGQKQRIAIARGLVRDARILILDEPTSALDPETEEYLVDALYEAAQEKLVIVIAHRLSTIASADRIYFLEEGQVLEFGSHSELMEIEDGHYRQYVDLQSMASTS
ncbi:MAG: ABC transporter ATP-binding protein [Gammaproteobacteria bacterium]|nr:ABC transporter ATP-binding protein [Gammaproteobacteria bacterium]